MSRVISGDAAAGGFEFQADAFAFIAAHALSRHPLDWFDGAGLEPVAMSMETGGPGDDLQVELANTHRIEVQVKKGLSRGTEFYGTLVRLGRAVSENPGVYGVLLIDLGASSPIRQTLREDFLRLSDGRQDDLKSETKELIEHLNRSGLTDLQMFRRLRIIVKDFNPSGDGRAAGVALLRSIIADPAEAGKAWTALCDEGLALSSRRGRRNTEQLAQLLRLRREI